MRHGYTRLGAGGYPVATVGKALVKVVADKVDAVEIVAKSVSATVVRVSNEGILSGEARDTSFGLARIFDEALAIGEGLYHPPPPPSTLLCTCEGIFLGPVVDAATAISIMLDASTVIVPEIAGSTEVDTVLDAVTGVTTSVEGQAGVTGLGDGHIELDEVCE
jgi:hypothetical protein